MARYLSKKLTTDFLWYLAGSLIPAMVSIVRLPVLTRYFSPEEYGYYSLVTITFTYLSVALYSWISSCLWRYYTTYKEERKLPLLYSNLAILFLLSTLLLFFVAIVWVALNNNLLVAKLVVCTMTYVSVNQLVAFNLIVYRLKKKSFFYNLLFSLQALSAFGLTLVMIFHWNYRIDAIPFAQALIAVVLLIFLIILNGSKITSLSFRYFSRPVMKELFQYGFVGFISNLGLMVLISSDRYIIALFSSMDSVGIYNQVYQLGQVSVYFLVTVFFNTINPSLVRVYLSKDHRMERILKGYIGLFIMGILPLSVYLSLFSRFVSAIMLGPAFQEGYQMIPLIMLSSFVYGLSLFSLTKLKFIKNYKPVVFSVLLACVVNAGLNFLLIPVWGYQSAALTTMIAYLVLFILMYRSDPLHYLKNHLIMNILFRMTTILVIQVTADLMVRKVFEVNLNIWWTSVEGLAFAFTYIAFVIRNRRKMQIASLR